MLAYCKVCKVVWVNCPVRKVRAGKEVKTTFVSLSLCFHSPLIILLITSTSIPPSMGDSQADFNRFVKNFSTRLIQTVVQSRLGRTTDTTCTLPTDEKDWFSFRVDELGEVAAYIGQSLQRFPPTIDCFTLEFILYTASGDYLPLEEWQISVDSEDKDPTVSMSNLYHQLGVLLRSCAIAARMTPLSRYYVKKQSSESFVVLYRILDTPGTAFHSSEEYNLRQLAKLPSPYGTLSVNLYFKQKVEASPRKSKSPAPSKKGHRSRPSSFSSAIPVEGSEKVEPSSPLSDHLHIFRGSPATPVSSKAPSSLSDEKRMDDCSSSEDEAGPCQCHYGSGISLPNMVEHSPVSGQEVRRVSSSFPFAVLLSSSKCKCSLEKINSPPVEPILHESTEEERREEPSHSNESESDSESEEEGEDSSADPLPSAKIFSISPSSSPVAPGSNLGEFIAQCRHAPVDGIHGVAEDSNLIKNQIDEFASHINEFDHFVREVEERVDHD
ncbi:hypothetical protein PMAYCL1PPCAC_30959 [Pristionchus mayeri]|uniref:Atg-13 n=1 Tax=Pristionchus mayeri TaxID=1317129 RepID=A0AAN5IDP0_9BILA|nr:hypothetical protein PMAYCL1PPCAC_30959 [Pristionchus mayeri]